MNKILIAEDEAPIANLIRTVLTDAGYRCVWASDGTQAADLLEKEPFDLALLDIMLPGFNGYELLEYCRELEVPAIFLTAKAEVEDRVKGLRLGAEDYLPKPFALPELLARVETVLRRCGKTERVLRLPPDIEIDTASRLVRRGGAPVALTAKEYDMLLLFVQNKNIASMSGYGARRSWETAAPWTCISSGCGKSWALRTGWWRCIRWATDWRCKACACFGNFFAV